MKRAIALFLILLPMSVFAEHGKLAKDLQQSDGDVDVIVQFKHTPGAQHHSKITSKGGVVHADLSLIKAVHARIPAKKLQEFVGSLGQQQHKRVLGSLGILGTMGIEQ